MPPSVRLLFSLSLSWVPPRALGSPPAGSSAPLRPLVVSLLLFHLLRGGPPSMMGAVSVTCVENLPSFSIEDFSPFFLFLLLIPSGFYPFLLLLDLLLLPSSWGQPSGAASGKSFLLILSAELASCFFSVLGTVSLGSRFGRKKSTSATGLYSVLVTHLTRYLQLQVL